MNGRGLLNLEIERSVTRTRRLILCLVMALVMQGVQGSAPFPEMMELQDQTRKQVTFIVAGSDGSVTGLAGWTGHKAWSIETGGDLVTMVKGEPQFIPAFKTCSRDEPVTEAQSVDFYTRQGGSLHRQGKLDELVGVPPSNMFLASKQIREYVIDYVTGYDSRGSPNPFSTVNIIRHDITLKVRKPDENTESVQTVGNIQVFPSLHGMAPHRTSHIVPKLIVTVDGRAYAIDEATSDILWETNLSISPVKLYRVVDGVVTELQLSLSRAPKRGQTSYGTLMKMAEARDAPEACTNEIGGSPFLQIGVSSGSSNINQVSFNTLMSSATGLLEFDGADGAEALETRLIGAGDWKYAPLVIQEKDAKELPSIEWVPQQPSTTNTTETDPKGLGITANAVLLYIGGFLSAALALIVAFVLRVNNASNLFRRQVPKAAAPPAPAPAPKLSLTEYTSTGDLDIVDVPMDVVQYEKKGTTGERSGSLSRMNSAAVSSIAGAESEGGECQSDVSEEKPEYTKLASVGRAETGGEEEGSAGEEEGDSSSSSSVQRLGDRVFTKQASASGSRSGSGSRLKSRSGSGSGSESTSASGSRSKDLLHKQREGAQSEESGSESSGSSSSGGKLGDRLFCAPKNDDSDASWDSASESSSSDRSATPKRKVKRKTLKRRKAAPEDLVAEEHTASSVTTATTTATTVAEMGENSTYKQNYDELYNIGAGGYGSVWLAENKTDKKRYAVKKIKLKNEVGNPAAKEENDKIKREASLHASLDHPNIARYNWSWEEVLTLDETLRAASRQGGTSSFTMDMSMSQSIFNTPNSKSKHLFIAMKYYMAGSLRDWLLNRTAINSKVNLRFLLQLVDGLLHLHDNQLLHRDMKPSNILMEKQGKKDMLKICDFGLSTIKQQYSSDWQAGQGMMQEDNQTTGAAGTPLYSSPEQMANLKYGKHSDIYSLGVILYELYLLDPSQHDRIRYLGKLSNKDRDKVICPDINREYMDEMLLVRDMTNPDWASRPTLKEIKLRAKALLKGMMKKRVQEEEEVLKQEEEMGYESDAEAKSSEESDTEDSDDTDEDESEGKTDIPPSHTTASTSPPVTNLDSRFPIRSRSV
eukprot:TRINITY_DN8650_c0_g1_i2.p1 TRINITY_DN8650_c0_g1~~TRINITY_DN8650_c0_g1_i2.p1  ORF type:complete len:1098 (+),score=333.68 TRINITY_DN8650_c0_g1_i2:299-3592(+)